jgi:cell division protease FtsH
LVDAEARRIVDACYDAALATLRENRDRLDRLAETLLEHETLDADAAYRAAGIPRTARSDLAAAGVRAASEGAAGPDALGRPSTQT